MSQVTLDQYDATEAEAVIARAHKVCLALEVELAKKLPGRPREWTVRGILTALVLLARHEHEFHIDRCADLIRTLPASTRERLGLNRPDGRPFTTRQISYAWNQICRCVDPAAHGLDDDERTRRLDLLQQVQNELLFASIDREYRRQWSGDIAVDATLIWSHGRPEHTANQKLYAGASDGDGIPTGKRVELLADIEDPTFDEPRSDHPFLDDLQPVPLAEVEFHEHSGRRRRRDRGNQAVGAKWIGGSSMHKVLFGYAHHIAVTIGDVPEQDDTEEKADSAEQVRLPPLAIGQVTTPTTSHPARSALGMLSDLQRRLADDPDRPADGPPLRDVLADGGYSQAKPEYWNLAIRSLGARPVFQLHNGNQAGHRGSLEGHPGGYLLIDGRYYCPCLPDDLRSGTYPRFGKFRDRNHEEMKEEYRSILAKREPYELRPRGTYREIGLRFSTPHADGGCPNCSDGCCETKTVTITWDQLGLYQELRHGSEEWARSKNRRSQVEGFFGALKTPTVGHHNRRTAQFFEYAKNSLAVTFASIATNLHLLANWHANRAAGRRKKRHRPGRPKLNPTLADIGNNPDVIGDVRQKKRRSRRKSKQERPPPPDHPFANLRRPQS